MKVWRNLPARSPWRGRRAAVTIGVFDGLHRGHRKILSRLVREARARNGPAVVVTFDPHPEDVLHPARRLPALTSLRDRLEGLARCGIDGAVVLPFTRRFSRTTPLQFLERIRRSLSCGALVFGPDFSLGHRRRGGPGLIRSWARRHGVSVYPVSPSLLLGGVVSSSRIRRLLSCGQVEKAGRLLGRPFQIEGTVVHGEGRGRRLGFPTANLDPELHPAVPPGVYACRVVVGRALFPAVCNIGHRPTFTRPAGPPVVEIHLLGGRATLYNRRLRVIFVRRLRAERRFPNAASLVRQIRRDVSRAERWAARTPPLRGTRRAGASPAPTREARVAGRPSALQAGGNLISSPAWKQSFILVTRDRRGYRLRSLPSASSN